MGAGARSGQESGAGRGGGVGAVLVAEGQGLGSRLEAAVGGHGAGLREDQVASRLLG